MYGNNRGPRRGPSGFGGGRGMGGPQTAPVKVGDELDVRIEAVGEKGDGVCKKDGFVIFVPNTKSGQNARIRVTRVLQRVGFGEVIGEASGNEGASAEAETPAAEEHDTANDSEDFGDEPAAAEESSNDVADEPAGNSDEFGDEEEQQ